MLLHATWNLFPCFLRWCMPNHICCEFNMQVEGIEVHGNEGGVTKTRGGVYWVILPAGCNMLFSPKTSFLIVNHPYSSCYVDWTWIWDINRAWNKVSVWISMCVSDKYTYIWISSSFSSFWTPLCPLYSKMQSCGLVRLCLTCVVCHYIWSNLKGVMVSLEKGKRDVNVTSRVKGSKREKLNRKWGWTNRGNKAQK